MSYDEILDITDLNKQEKCLKEYYFDNIKIDKWLINNYDFQIIKFKDRTEYKKNNKYHNIFGPAIDYKNDDKNEYYIKGKKLLKKDWVSISKTEILKLKLNKIKIE